MVSVHVPRKAVGGRLDGAEEGGFQELGLKWGRGQFMGL